MVARLSSRVFLGEEVCRDEKWLAITKSYTILAFGAATSIRDYPSWTRPIVHWFDPVCQQLRQQVRDAANIINPVLQARRDIKRQAVVEKRLLPAFNDAIDWFEQESRDPYDAVGMQLGLSIVAIHTTTDLVLESLSRIAADEQLLADLRREAVSVLGSEGWQKSALVNLKLLDSVLKETQRLKPITSGT
jgi:cytochrome P450